MDTHSSQSISRREQRAREKAMPELSQEFRAILVGKPYGERLQSFLRDNGISDISLEVSFCDIIALGGAPDFVRIQNLINEWIAGKGFSATNA